MTVAIDRQMTRLLIVLTLAVIHYLSPPFQSFSICFADEDPRIGESSECQSNDCSCSESLSCLWEINTRCLPIGHCEASAIQELETHRFIEGVWCGSSEHQLFQELECSPVWTILFVHGNRTSAEQARNHSIFLFQSLQRRASEPFRLICLSWPSEKPRQISLPSVLVQEKKDLLRTTGVQLAHFLGRAPHGSVDSMIGFSFGCSIIGCALHLQAGGSVDGCCATGGSCESDLPCKLANGCLHLGFIAPAMDRCALQPSGIYSSAMASVGHLVNLYNSRDPVLRRFRFFDRENPIAAGYAGLMDTRFEPLAQNSQIEQFDCRSIGTTHALIDYCRCSAFDLLVDNVLGNGPVTVVSQISLPTRLEPTQ